MQLEHLHIIVRLASVRVSESHTFVCVRVIVRAITIKLRTGSAIAHVLAQLLLTHSRTPRASDGLLPSLQVRIHVYT